MLLSDIVILSTFFLPPYILAVPIPDGPAGGGVRPAPRDGPSGTGVRPNDEPGGGNVRPIPRDSSGSSGG